MFLKTCPFFCPSIRDVKGLCCDKAKISLLCNEMKISRRIICQTSKKKEDVISCRDAINEERDNVAKVNSAMGIGITSFFEGKNIFLTGATGLLGKVLVEKILRSTPIRKIYVLVKPDDLEAVKNRLMKELVNSELFGCVQEKHGNYYQEFMKESLIPIVSDICKPCLGVDCDSTRAIMEDVNVIIGSAAITTMNERQVFSQFLNLTSSNLIL